MFLIVALASGLTFMFVTPPFQAPDEPPHFYRAYAVSEGEWLAASVDERTGNLLPTSLVRFAELFSGAAGNAEQRIDPNALKEARQLKLNPGERTFVDFPNTAVYPPLAYLPQAVAIAIGRLWGAGPLTLLYLARLSNLLAATALLYLAIRYLPAYRWLFALVMLSPMAVFLRSTASADTLSTAFGSLLVAVIARLAFGTPERAALKDLALITASSAALCLTKIPFLPLVFMAFLIPVRKLPIRRGRFVTLVLTAAGAAFTAAAALAWSVKASLRTDVGVRAKEQVVAALFEPFRFFAIVLRDYADHTPRYAAEFIGRLGWLDTPLPVLLLASFAASLFALVVLDTDAATTVEPWQRRALTGLVLSVLFLISASQYAMWTPLGADHIDGIQGRHFHPAALAVPWVFYTRRWAGLVSSRWIGGSVTLFSVLSLLVAVIALSERYYG